MQTEPSASHSDLRARLLVGNAIGIQFDVMESKRRCARAVSMGNTHRALPLTLAMCLATACRTPGTIPHQIAALGDDGRDVRLGNPSGVIVAGADVEMVGNAWTVHRCRVMRTQRRLMEGSVLVPEKAGQSHAGAA